MSAESLQLIIRNHQEIVFQGVVEAVTSTNAKGEFDVLPRHAFYIGLIEKFIIIHLQGGKKQQIPIDNGVMHVSENIVRIYLVIPTKKSSRDS